MNLDELRTVQSKERSKDSLQHLRESFYSDVADYIADLRERRDQAAERADDPFADPEVRRLTDEIETAEEVVEGVYERRVGKVVKRASLSAMGVAADAEGLTAEEQELFDRLVERIETNKQGVLDVLAGKETDVSESSPSADAERTPDPGEPPVPSDEESPVGESGERVAPSGDVSAADVMGSGGSDAAKPTGQSASRQTASEAEDGDSRPSAEAATVADDPDRTPPEEATPDSTPETDDATDPEPSGADDRLAVLDERVTLRLTDDVGEILGVDERTYDLASEDVVTLPEANAEPLLEQGAAEELE